MAHLKTKVIVVLGHQSCGAVTAAIGGGNNGYNLNHLLCQIQPAIDSAGDNATVDQVVQANAQEVVKDLQSRSDILSDAVNQGELKIVPAYYHLDSGQVEFLA